MSEKSRGVGRWTEDRASYRIPGDSRLWSRPENHCSLRVAISLDTSVPECTVRTLCSTAYHYIFDARNFHRTISPCPTYRRDYVRENARSLERKRNIRKDIILPLPPRTRARNSECRSRVAQISRCECLMV